jgi:hypothetical protein
MDKRKVIFGLILILLGFYFIGRTTDIIWFDLGDIFEYFWPLLFIGLGIWLIVRKRKPTRPPPPPPGPQPTGSQSTSSQSTGTWSQSAGTASAESSANASASAGPSTGHTTTDQPAWDTTGKLKYDKFIGDVDINMNGMPVTNVEVSSFIGDIDMRLHGATLTQGLNRIVISGFIGDVRILIPADLPIFVHASNFVNDIDLMGQRVSGFSNTLDSQTEKYTGAESKIYLAINTFIGDIRVYKV